MPDRMKMVTVYVDGGGGDKAHYGYFIKETGESSYTKEPGLTNNQAEYKAILRALTNIQDFKYKIMIKSDSKNTVEQLKHNYAINNETLRELARQIWSMMGQMETQDIIFQWVPRKENLAGKMLGS